jgi:hypothetical protein
MKFRLMEQRRTWLPPLDGDCIGKQLDKTAGGGVIILLSDRDSDRLDQLDVPSS